MIWSKKGQVWVETMIYTLIGLVLIGIVLAFATPKINEAQEKLVIEQTIDSLGVLDEKINSALRAPGNVRTIPFTIKKGEINFDGENDKIIFVLDGMQGLYSEPGVEIEFGRIQILSEEGDNDNSVSLTLDYEGIADITLDGENNLKKFNRASLPYEFSVTSVSSNEIDISEISGR